jgi:hypothetical protein
LKFKKYNKEFEYKKLIKTFFFASEEFRKENNIIYEPYKENPEELQSIINKFNISQRNNASSDNLKEIFKSYFIWTYLNDASQNPEKLLGLALFEKKNSFNVEQTNLLISDLKTFLKPLENYVSAYFKNIIQLLKTPPIMGEEEEEEEEEEGIDSVKRIPRLRVFDFPTYMTSFTVEDFVFQNKLLSGKDPMDFVIYKPFLDFVTHSIGPDGKEVNHMPQQEYCIYAESALPTLKLERLFTLYSFYTKLSRRYLSERIDNISQTLVETEKKITDISRESDDFSFLSKQQLPYFKHTKSFNSQPINNGVVRLKAEVVTHMSKAYSRVKQHCPRLSGLSLEDLQGDVAFQCGLTTEFANFVAALIAENQLTFPNAYKSLAMQRHVITHTTDIMNQLKNYQYSGGGKGDRARISFDPRGKRLVKRILF